MEMEERDKGTICSASIDWEIKYSKVIVGTSFNINNIHLLGDRY